MLKQLRMLIWLSCQWNFLICEKLINMATSKSMSHAMRFHVRYAINDYRSNGGYRKEARPDWVGPELWLLQLYPGILHVGQRNETGIDTQEYVKAIANGASSWIYTSRLFWWNVGRVLRSNWPGGSIISMVCRYEWNSVRERWYFVS